MQSRRLLKASVYLIWLCALLFAIEFAFNRKFFRGIADFFTSLIG
jgi:hypothetical protein